MKEQKVHTMVRIPIVAAMDIPFAYIAIEDNTPNPSSEHP